MIFFFEFSSNNTTLCSLEIDLSIRISKLENPLLEQPLIDGRIIDDIVFVNFDILSVQWNFCYVDSVSVLRNSQIMRTHDSLQYRKSDSDFSSTSALSTYNVYEYSVKSISNMIYCVSQCRNYGNLLILFFGKYFVKVTFLLKKLVRCPKLLFGKFNILEFKRGAEQGSQRTKNVLHQIYQF